MKQNNGDCFIVGIGTDEHEYVVNGVRYIVSTRYAPTALDGEGEHTLSDRLKNYVSSDLSDLTESGGEGMLEDEYAFSAAGKED
ncbi:MAG: hypothetical protein E7422_12100 [Ruminococcaceae bacterium]|nr:hypothetical protein [Oscillospiraceae bacterium]